MWKWWMLVFCIRTGKFLWADVSCLFSRQMEQCHCTLAVQSPSAHAGLAARGCIFDFSSTDCWSDPHRSDPPWALRQYVRCSLLYSDGAAQTLDNRFPPSNKEAVKCDYFPYLPSAYGFIFLLPSGNPANSDTDYSDTWLPPDPRARSRDAEGPWGHSKPRLSSCCLQ